MISRRHGIWIGQLVFLLAAAACGCGQLTGLRLPFLEKGLQVVHYPKPQLTLDHTPFENAGCPQGDSRERKCGEDSPLRLLGCTAIRSADDLLGGLDPAYPLALCLVRPEDHRRLGSGFLYTEGCLLPTYIRLVLYQDGRYTLIKDQAELQSAFAPIETPEEALSYTLAATGHMAWFGVEPDKKFEYLVEKLEDTHVAEDADGYVVNLYHFQLCGCGPHDTSEVKIRVSQTGEMETLSKTPVMRDPQMEGMCID